MRNLVSACDAWERVKESISRLETTSTRPAGKILIADDTGLGVYYSSHVPSLSLQQMIDDGYREREGCSGGKQVQRPGGIIGCPGLHSKTDRSFID